MRAGASIAGAASRLGSDGMCFGGEYKLRLGINAATEMRCWLAPLLTRRYHTTTACHSHRRPKLRPACFEARKGLKRFTNVYQGNNLINCSEKIQCMD